jgi:hypothetical protein
LIALQLSAKVINMSAEMHLLDDLTGSDESLYYAWRLFGGDAEALEQARYSISMQVKEGLIEVLRKTNDDIQALVDWEIRQVLADEANWRNDAETKYFLSLTKVGAKFMGYL